MLVPLLCLCHLPTDGAQFVMAHNQVTIHEKVTDAHVDLLAALDEKMSQEIAELHPLKDAPLMPALGRDWFAKHCLTNRASFAFTRPLVVEVSGETAGFIVFNPSIWRAKKRKRGKSGGVRRNSFVEVFCLSVDPAARRRGVARALLLEARRVAKRDFASDVVGEHRLRVMINNEPAIKLYKSLGFEILALKKGYPQKPYDAHRMAWRDGGGEGVNSEANTIERAENT